jgi:hypothetical protein
MDTSTTLRKAMTDAEKQKVAKEGRCFECSQQGHFALDCRKKKTRTRATTVHEDTPRPKARMPLAWPPLWIVSSNYRRGSLHERGKVQVVEK